MAAPDSAPPAPRRLEVGWLELGFILLVVLAGFSFLRDAPYWGRNAYAGTAQFGDAEFWWNGALHFSQGIVAENPNLSYRMGYATFAGCFVAVFGPNYHLFHGILLTLFLGTVSGLYLSLRGLIGRLAAGAALLFFVFNPYTAEWLAISTSDSLGLILNLAALMALVAGVRDGLRLRWIALFSVFLACASLTRPLMTPFIVPAALAVVVTGWRAWRRTALTLGVMFAAFVLPTFAWMGFMVATTGNFALTGASQDASAFYAASDPQIQTWRPEMYTAVNESAMQRFGTANPTPQQLNAEFWTMTRANYAKHWRFHLKRVTHHVVTLAKFTPGQSTMHTSQGGQWRQRLKWLLVVALVVASVRQQRQWPAILLVLLGSCWVLQPAATPWMVLAGGTAGLAALLVRRSPAFLWAAYWWVGAIALYLTGGTWEPPAGPVPEVTALGYRLGFQFLFVNDVLVAGLLGGIALGRTAAPPLDDNPHRLICPSPEAGRLLRRCTATFVVLLSGLLLCGSVIVTWRIVARHRIAAVPYPDPAGLTQTPAARGAKVLVNLDQLREALNLRAGRPVLTCGTSSGFIWNLPGQERSMLLLYQQDNVRPVALSPRHLYVEASRHLPEREWMNRQGAWVLRSFPNTAQVSSLPYYFEMPAVEAFVPLSADGRSYDLDHAVRFPLAKSATQLAAGGALTFTRGEPEWSLDSGAMKFPRRFALRADPAGAPVGWNLDLAHTRGARAFSFSVERDADSARPPSHLRLVTNGGEVLWEGDLTAGAPSTLVQPVLPPGATGLRFTCDDLGPGEILWFYELVLQADDFTQ
jgi:4-amino-4-deoxy-L-arabinose transferase-like glycosyltransferase